MEDNETFALKEQVPLTETTFTLVNGDGNTVSLDCSSDSEYYGITVENTLYGGNSSIRLTGNELAELNQLFYLIAKIRGI